MSYQIVIVEDDVIISEMLKGMLEHHNYEIAGVVRYAGDVEQYITETSPDLVLLDINLQEKGDGFDVARQILEKRQIPILFLSGDTSDIIEARINSIPGAVLMGKPVVLVELESTVRKLLGESTQSV